MGQVIRSKEIRRRRTRRVKMQKLRQRYAVSKTKKEKDEVLAKVRRIAPLLTEEQFLASLKK